MAAQLDDLLIDAWSGHPHHLIIDNSTGYSEKLERALDALKGLLCEAELAHEPEQAPEHEPEHEPEPECEEEVPEVPDIDDCMTLQDLASDQFSQESEALQLSEIETIKVASDFFGHQSSSGAIADMLRFARHLDAVIEKYWCQKLINLTECAKGHLSITYVRIPEFTSVYSGCYDGGGGNFELEDDGATLKALHFEKMDDVSWDELKRVQMNEKDFERYRRQWGHSDYHEFGSTPVILSGNGLYMLDPFGLKGLYRMRITSERVYD